MLDIHLFREEVDKIRADHDRRGIPHDNIEKVIELDTQWKLMLRETNELRRKKNEAARGIGAAKKSGDEAEAHRILSEVANLGEQISERGIGNGISIIIATSILTGIPGAIGQALEQARQGDLNILLLLGIGVLAMLVIAIVVFIERGQRRITVNYAQRQQGRKLMQAQASHLPFKVNMAGVIPAIFASTFLLFPASLSTWFGQAESFGFLQTISLALNPGQPLYILTFSALIISFCFIWLALTFDTKEVTDNLKKSGAFVPGIRPGEQTAAYVDSVLARLTVFGSIYLTLICLLPLALINFAGVSFYLGGTSVLIIVVVLMDFMSQVQSHMMSSQYSSLLKKANLKNYSR